MGLGNDELDEGEVLRVNDLRVAFEVNGSPVEVVKGIGFRVCSGAVTAIVGESGSGKSVTAQAIMRILPKNGTILSGSINFRPKSGEIVDMAALPPNGPKVRSLRGSADLDDLPGADVIALAGPFDRQSGGRKPAHPCAGRRDVAARNCAPPPKRRSNWWDFPIRIAPTTCIRSRCQAAFASVR